MYILIILDICFFVNKRKAVHIGPLQLVEKGRQLTTFFDKLRRES